MSSRRIRLVAAALLLAGAVPALAQTIVVPVPPAPPAPPINPFVVHRFGGSMLGELSPQGRKVMRDAMRDEGGDRTRAALEATRQRMLKLLMAQKLDLAAMRREMEAERELAGREQRRRQDAMLDAFRRLSVEDRRAFAGGMREQKERVEKMRRDIQRQVVIVQRKALQDAARATAQAERAAALAGAQAERAAARAEAEAERAAAQAEREAERAERESERRTRHDD